MPRWVSVHSNPYYTVKMGRLQVPVYRDRGDFVNTYKWVVSHPLLMNRRGIETDRAHHWLGYVPSITTVRWVCLSYAYMVIALGSGEASGRIRSEFRDRVTCSFQIFIVIEGSNQRSLSVVVEG